ncbi:glycosyltransferase [Kibdelosporangium lantanae]
MTDRIAVVGMPAAGHFNPSLPIARELARSGYAVTYYIGEEFRDRVTDAGCEFRGYPSGSLSSKDIADATRNGGPVRVVARILRATEDLLPMLLADLGTDRPAALAFDSNAIWGRMAAARLGLPSISLMTTILIGGKAMSTLKPREWIHFLGEAIPGVPAARSAKRRVVRRFGKDVYPPAPGLPMRGDVTIFPVPRWMQPPDPRIDDSCHYVGPTIPVRPKEKEPLVLVSLGTLHAGSDTFFRACFEAFAGLPARVVLVTRADVGTPPPNVTVEASVPQLDVLRRASVFVTHGGMNSVLEGLSCGVPLVVVPQQVEQLVIGRSVADRGAGIVLRQNLANRPVPASELRAAVDAAFGMADAARVLGRSLSEGGGAPAAVEAIRAALS